VGGGPGTYAAPLARRGYRVHLVDPVPLHVDQARQASGADPAARFTAALGDARELPGPDATQDAVLLFGPLYHLTETQQRRQALTQARRVLAPGGRLLAMAVSRFASLLDGLYADWLDDPVFGPIVDQDLVHGQHVAQVFLADEDWAGALQGVHAALRPRGYLVFETRRPDWRAWEEWAAEAGRRVIDIPGIGSVEQRSEVTGVRFPFVSARGTYTFGADGAVIVSDSTPRFRSRDELESSLVSQGYRVLDVRQAPDRPGREFVFIAERTT
jgi:SAM-dependent methyltransferase